MTINWPKIEMLSTIAKLEREIFTKWEGRGEEESAHVELVTKISRANSHIVQATGRNEEEEKEES